MNFLIIHQKYTINLFIQYTSIETFDDFFGHFIMFLSLLSYSNLISKYNIS